MDWSEEDEEDDVDEGEEVDELEVHLATESTVCCPYCGERVTVAPDPGGGTLQEYIEDCQVCCRPWRVRVTFSPSGQPFIEVDTVD